VHPDFVPPNAITTPDDHRVIVDWAGAGRGPRLWSLALLLWAGGMRDPRLVDVAMSRYAKHVTLNAAELGRLESVIAARPLTMDIWSFAHGRRDLPAILANLNANRAMAPRIAEQAQLLAGD
jgi:thiamine kinase-like enzyme